MPLARQDRPRAVKIQLQEPLVLPARRRVQPELRGLLVLRLQVWREPLQVSGLQLSY